MKHLISNELLPLTLAAVLLVSKYFFHWLLNAPIENFCVASDLRKDNIHLPSLKPFITKEASLEKIKKKQCFFLICRSAIVKIAHDDSSSQSYDSDVAVLRKHVHECWIPLLSAT